MNKEAGFTLIEIIVSLMLVGFLTLFAGLGIATFSRGYLFAKENAHMSQKAQLAMARISRELMELLDITSAPAPAPDTAVTFESTTGDRTIGLDNDEIKIAESGTALDDGDVLVNDVIGLTLSYFKGSDTWVYGTDDIQLLSAIEFELVMSRPDSGVGDVTFFTTVYLRNNNNYGGAPPTELSEIPTKGDYCFLATAAYGRSDHPVVLVLRQFRDKFLMSWEGGKTLVKGYYSAGPFLAERIKDRAWACAAVRQLLSPLFGFAFLMLNFPSAIPLIMLLSWLGTRGLLAIFRNRKFQPLLPILSDVKGTVLIGMIMTIVIISALGAAMLPLTATSTFTQVRTNSTARAYFLAESGFRYAASEYLNENENARNVVLETLNQDVTYTLSNNNGSFKIDIYPYYFETLDPATNGSNELYVKVYGDPPPNWPPDSGYLKVGTGPTDLVESYDSVNISEPNLTFIKDSGQWPASAIAGRDIFVVSVPDGSSTQTVTDATYSDLLELQSANSGSFPERNGIFRIYGDTTETAYTYKKRNIDTLEGISLADKSGDTFSFSVNNSNFIILEKFVELHSTGTFGQGDIEVKRKLIYHVPLPATSGERAVFHDTFEDKSHWEESSLGSHEIETIGDDKALKVISTTDIGAGDEASLIALDSSTTDVELSLAHEFGDNMLSYDAQVKIGFASLPLPLTAPDDYMAGISFRLGSLGTDANSYGISFIQGGSSDGIPDEFVPYTEENFPMIVLWQQTNSGNDKTWLAYKHLMGRPIFFSDDMESGTNGWSSSGLWHQTETYVRYRSFSHAWYYGQPGFEAQEQEELRNYDTGFIERGALISTDIDLTSATSAMLTFWTWHKTEPDISWDEKWIYISTDGGPWTQLRQLTGNALNWVPISIDLSSYIGETIKIAFYFDTEDNIENQYEGWYIDDVTISGDFPVNEATLMVRIKEAVSLPFNSGGTTINDEVISINYGDIIIGETSRAWGTVIGNPIVSSGTWADGDAAGIILLKKKEVSGTFNDSEALLVGGIDLATSNGTFRERDNYIKAYYSDTSGYGTPNSDPLDYEKHGNPRGEANWPPDEVDDWSAGNDYFTLVQWDEVNSVSIVDSRDEPEAIIRSNEPNLLTPDSGYIQPELGLHTFGNNSTFIYFDDFALQADIIKASRVAPIQQ